MNGEAASPDGLPVEPGPGEELRGKRPRAENEGNGSDRDKRPAKTGKKREGRASRPVPTDGLATAHGRESACALALRRGFLLPCSAPRDGVHQPGLWNDKQRREKETKQRVQPDQRDVECAERDTDPQNSERTIRFHDELPLRRCHKIESQRQRAKWYGEAVPTRSRAYVTRPPDLHALVMRSLPRTEGIVLAVSGGLDSMVLLDVAAHSGREATERITVATFDHASGAHSARAASLVVERALGYGLPVVVGRADGCDQSEAAWRAERWEFLRSAAAASGSLVLTAHTRDDQVETVLMRAMRGAGARGLAALAASSDVRRPFLHVRRQDLLAYANARGLPWLEDPTNRSRQYLRNRVRLDLLPAIRRVAPQFEEDLLDIARRASSWRSELAALVDRHVAISLGCDEHGAATLDVAAADLADYSRTTLAVLWPELASRVGLALDARGTRRAAEFTIAGRVGSRIQISGGWELVRSRSRFELQRAPRGVPSRPALSFGAPMTWDRWSFSTKEADAPRDAWTATLPKDDPLQIRGWRAGDRMRVFQRGRLIARKVKYFLSDAGISGHIRARWPVVVAGDEVVWIPGVRRSDAATVRSGRPVVTYVCDYLDRRP